MDKLAGFVRNNIKWYIMTMVNLGFVMFVYRDNPPFAVQLAALIGVIYLGMTLLPKNILYWLPVSWTALRGRVQNLVVMRRDFGITAGFTFLIHAILALVAYGNFEASFLFMKSNVFGVAALFIFIALLLTSSNASIRYLRARWRSLHSLIWLGVPFILIHSLLAKAAFQGDYDLLGIAGVIGLILFVLLEAALILINPQKPFLDKWKHVRLILIGTILAMLLFLVYPNK